MHIRTRAFLLPIPGRIKPARPFLLPITSNQSLSPAHSCRSHQPDPSSSPFLQVASTRAFLLPIPAGLINQSLPPPHSCRSHQPEPFSCPFLQVASNQSLSPPHSCRLHQTRAFLLPIPAGLINQSLSPPHSCRSHQPEPSSSPFLQVASTRPFLLPIPAGRINQTLPPPRSYGGKDCMATCTRLGNHAHICNSNFDSMKFLCNAYHNHAQLILYIYIYIYIYILYTHTYMHCSSLYQFFFQHI